MITAMILAGGSGSRVGAGRPKQFVEILGKPVLAYTIELYQKNPQVDAIEIVCHADWIHYLETIIENYRLSKVVDYAWRGDISRISDQWSELSER